MSLHYIAAPYTHPNKEVVNKRVEIVCKYSALLMKRGILNVSPITMGTGIFQYAELPSDWKFWNQLSFELLSRCDMLFVLKLDDWKESEGVQAEIKFAKEKNIRIEHVDEDFLKTL